MRRTRGNVSTRCVGCNALKHTACERRLDLNDPCTCKCVNINGGLEWWALVETARKFPESAAAHAVVAGSIFICWSGGTR